MLNLAFSFSRFSTWLADFKAETSWQKGVVGQTRLADDGQKVGKGTVTERNTQSSYTLLNIMALHLTPSHPEKYFTNLLGFSLSTEFDKSGVTFTLVLPQSVKCMFKDREK